MTARSRLAVLGSPIAHSKSPAIHRAAYEVLGLDWSYGSADVSGAGLSAFIEGLDESWRGLSLTMPLKRDVLPLLASRDPLVDVVGGANTVLFSDAGIRGFNTDVQGIVKSFTDAEVDHLDLVQILGAGATAASVIVAAGQLGATRAQVSARSPEKAQPLVPLGESVGVEVLIRPWGISDRSLIAPSAIVSTLPGGENDLVFAEAIREQSVLFDIAYDPWPSDLARAWTEVGGTVISGLDLLINQAVGQIRVFLHGDPGEALPREAEVITAMRAAVER